MERLKRAFHGVDFVIHAAALKQVDTGEYNPMEFVKTNVLTYNTVQPHILIKPCIDYSYFFYLFIFLFYPFVSIPLSLVIYNMYFIYLSMYLSIDLLIYLSIYTTSHLYNLYYTKPSNTHYHIHKHYTKIYTIVFTSSFDFGIMGVFLFIALIILILMGILNYFIFKSKKYSLIRYNAQ